MSAAVATLVAIVLGFGMSTASASQLVVTTSNQTTLQSLYKCNSASAVGAVSLGATTSTTTTSSTTVTLSNIPAACRGKSITVDVWEGSTRKQGILAGGSSNGSATVTLPTFAPSGVTAVVVKVDGWLFPATWSYTPPPSSPMTCIALDTAGNPTGQSCTVTVTKVDKWGNIGSRLANASFIITTAATNWTVSINLATMPLAPGWAPRSVRSNGNPLVLTGYSCGELPIVRGKANLGWAEGDRKGLYLELAEQAGVYSGGNSFCS